MLVTSAHPGEGKSTTATNIAMAMALDGKSVILVDTDLRRSNLHYLLKLLPVPGLTDVLFGHVSLDEVLQSVESTENLKVLTGGSMPPNPSEILNSRAFTSLLQKLVSKADVVIFDSPPVLIGADASILASQMDATVMVVATGTTKKIAARHAVGVLRLARARMIGVVYNKMTVSADYGYYYSHYYSPYYTGESYGGTSEKTHRRGLQKLLHKRTYKGYYSRRPHGDEQSSSPVEPKGDGEE
jgi:capsular exopolysaccharide synthesis family protein